MKSLPVMPFIAAQQPRFTLLDPVRNRVALILFCGAFSFLFMYIFLPFNINVWYEKEPMNMASLFGIFSGCGMAGLCISQFLLSGVKWRKQLTAYTYLLWMCMELVLISSIVTIVDVLITDIFFLTWKEFFNTMRYTALIMPLPYFIALLWFYTREKEAQLKEVTTTPAITAPSSAETCLRIHDEHNRAVLSLSPAKLLLIKAEDNYVHIYYYSGGGVNKELVRTSLKKLEAQLGAAGFARAHRSYLVNLSKVVLFKKNTKGHYLHLEGLDDLPVPVSSTCLPLFREHFAPAS